MQKKIPFFLLAPTISVISLLAFADIGSAEGTISSGITMGTVNTDVAIAPPPITEPAVTGIPQAPSTPPQNAGAPPAGHAFQAVFYSGSANNSNWMAIQKDWVSINQALEKDLSALGTPIKPSFVVAPSLPTEIAVPQPPVAPANGLPAREALVAAPAPPPTPVIPPTVFTAPGFSPNGGFNATLTPSSGASPFFGSAAIDNGAATFSAGAGSYLAGSSAPPPTLNDIAQRMTNDLNMAAQQGQIDSQRFNQMQEALRTMGTPPGVIGTPPASPRP